MTLIGIPEAAPKFGVDRATLWRWIDEGKLTPAFVILSAEGKRKQAFLIRADVEALTARLKWHDASPVNSEIAVTV